MSLRRYVMGTIFDLLRGDAATLGELHLDFGDCRIRVESNSARLLTELDAYFGAFVTMPGPEHITVTAVEAESPSLPLDLAARAPDPGKEKVKEEYADLPGGRVVRKRLTGLVLLFGSGRNLAVGPCEANPNQVVNFINNRYIEHKLRQGCLLGHSAAVARVSGSGMRGLALCGFSGAGKSTLAMHIMSRGAAFVSNDRLLVEQSGAGLRMSGVAKLPRINPGTALNNPHLAGVVPEEDRERFAGLDGDELWTLEHKYDVFLDRCFGEGRFVLAAPMHGLVVLNWRRGGGEAHIRFVKAKDRPDLLPAFMKPAGLFCLPEGGGAWVDPGPEAYAEALSRCDVVEISGGVDFERAADLCREYLVHG